MAIQYFRSKIKSLSALALFCTAISPLAGHAQEITLTSNDGALNIVGKFIEFSDDAYVVETALGRLQIKAGRVQCSGDACPRFDAPAADVVMVGSSTIAEGLMPFLVEGFAMSRNGVIESHSEADNVVTSSLVAEGGFGDPIGSFSIAASDSASAFAALREPTVKIGMSSRRIEPAEARQLRNFGAGNMIDVNQEHIVAVDSISVIVHPDNPIGVISMENLDLIFSGRVTNWSEIGGPDMPIKVYRREDGAGTQTVLEAVVFAASGRTMMEDAFVANSHDNMSSAVRNDPRAIGFIPTAFERGTKALALQGTCGITSSPTAFNAKTEEYPLQRRLYLYNRADNVDPTTQSFIDYAMSQEADVAVTKSGLFDLSIIQLPQDQQNGRVRSVLTDAVDPFEFGLARDMLLDMFEWNRLSTTFRFASGSARLDGKGQADLARLIDFLKSQPEGTEMSVVGFTDGDGAFGPNQRLSVGRAEQVLAEIQTAAGDQLSNINIQVKGYGELSPAACNDTLEGKRVNRRVEIWVRNPA